MKIMKLSGMGMILLTIFITSLPDIARAHGGMRSMGPGPTVHINHVIRVSPKPPGWPQMWLARDIIKSFNENELIEESSASETKGVLFDFPADTNEVIKFSVSLNERKLKGYVVEFEKKKDFETIQGHYLELNNNNELHTWSLVKDNILVVIEGDMHENEIQAYKAVLENIK